MLHGNSRWRLAVWGCRLSMLGVATIVGGLLGAAASSSSAGLWVAIGGTGMLLAGDAVIFLGLTLVRRDRPKPRPAYRTLRRGLVRDALHARPRGGGVR